MRRSVELMATNQVSSKSEKLVTCKKHTTNLPSRLWPFQRKKKSVKYFNKRYWNFPNWFKILMQMFRSYRDGGLSLHWASEEVRGLVTHLSAQADVRRWTCRVPWPHTQSPRIQPVFPTACYSGVPLCHSSDHAATEKDHLVCLVK